MYCVQKIRRRRGKESLFYRYGLPIKPAKLSRSIKAHGFEYEPLDGQGMCHGPLELDRR